jgi:molybdate transport system ATP-binding protein
MLHVAVETELSAFHLEVNCAVEEGTTTVLLGESGAGKSTVLRLLAGLAHPRKGHFSLEGVTYFDSDQNIVVPPQERPFGYVFQDYVLFPHLNVFENVAFGMRAQHLPQRLVRQRVEEALERVRLPGFERRLPGQLSGGQQQRVAIARALALQPRLLLLDEPLAALDVQTRREIRQELRRILSETAITTVMVTHQYLEALFFGQHIVVLDQGRIIQQGGQRDLRLYPRSSYVAELVGVNFFQGEITHFEANTMCTIQLRNGSRLLEVIAVLKERDPQEQIPEIGARAYVVVDPRSVTLHPTRPDSSARNIFWGEIVHMLRLPAAGEGQDDGSVRVSIALDTDQMAPPLIAEITESSASRLGLYEGKTIYATFKATEARAYI